MCAKYNPEIHHRRSIRLKNYDYSSEGLYFITICTHNRQHLFGEIKDRMMYANETGAMIEEEYYKLPDKFPHVVLHSHIVMPNHFHCIIQICHDIIGRADPAPTIGAIPVHALGNIIGYFKYITTKKANFAHHLWQRNYFEHVIRSAEKFDYIDNYIKHNPERWPEDCMNRC